MENKIHLDKKNKSRFMDILYALQDMNDIWEEARDDDELTKDTLDDFHDHLSEVNENYQQLTEQLEKPHITEKEQKLTTQIKGNLHLLLGSIELVEYGYAKKDFVRQSTIDCLEAITKEVKEFLDIS